MDIFTVDRNFERQDLLETFISAIWTERFFGDSEFELLLEPSAENVTQFAPSTFVMEADSDEPQIVETLNIEDGKLKVSGISLTQWLNNRFIRSSPWPDDKSWDVTAIKPGVLMGQIVQNWCIDSVYLNNSTTYNQPPDTGHTWPSGWTLDENTMGIVHSYLTKLKIPDLYLGSVDSSGSDIDYSVPFGPVYDVLKDLAQAYTIGQKITLDEHVVGEYHVLRYKNYKGLDRTSTQHVNQMVRFSPELDSLSNIKELHSISGVIGVLFTFPTQLNGYEVNYYGAPASENPLTPFLGHVTGSGWDLRAAIDFDDELDPSDVSGRPPTEGPSSSWPYTELFTAANNIYDKTRTKQRILLSLPSTRGATIVDGEIVPTNQFKYGRDYNLGDIVELEAHSEVVSPARVTEYIRAQDAAGYREYPTVELLQG